MRTLKFASLTAACLVAGYGFYRMTDDAITAGFFTFGILGIVLSVMRDGPRD